MSFYYFALLCIAAFFDRSGVMLWGILAALLHECGHLAVMLCLPGQAPKELCITPFGIKIEKSPLAEFAGGNLFVLAAGSGVNFISSAVTFGLLPRFAAVSVVLGILNLLPVLGMDGGEILFLTLCRLLDESSAKKAVRIISRLTLSVMAAGGTYIFAVTGYNCTLLGATAALGVADLKKNRRG